MIDKECLMDVYHLVLNKMINLSGALESTLEVVNIFGTRVV